MDPNATYVRILRLAHFLKYKENPPMYDTTELCELILALDEWVANGGFLPTALTPKKDG